MAFNPKRLIVLALLVAIATVKVFAITNPNTEETIPAVVESVDPRVEILKGYSEKLTTFEHVSPEFAEELVWLCDTDTNDTQLCLEHIIGVASAESSVFKRCHKNNCMGLMYRTKQGNYSLRAYDTVIDGLRHWLTFYNKNSWHKRTTGQKWLDGKYCTSECKFWIGNYNSAIKKLGL